MSLLTDYLPKAVIEAINSCLVDQASPIIGQVRPLLVSYDSIRSRLQKPMADLVSEIDGLAMLGLVHDTYATSWWVEGIKGWGYCFTPKVVGRE